MRHAATLSLLAEFNATAPEEDAKRAAILKKLLGAWNGAIIRPPFEAEHGGNIHFDEACFVNSGCLIQDTAPVHIGAFTQISPSVQILTRTIEGTGSPVTIGRNVWIGASAVINPGVTLGDDAIVSAGAVVVEDVPEGATVAGNPARVVG
jgi:maltose O-acetyltransferase